MIVSKSKQAWEICMLSIFLFVKKILVIFIVSPMGMFTMGL
jgi:hypothetical protein